jgi:hypothetical protein
LEGVVDIRPPFGRFSISFFIQKKQRPRAETRGLFRMRCNIYFVVDESGTAFFTVSLPRVPWPNVNIW